MLKYILFFVAFRFLVQNVSDTYSEGVGRCRELVRLAKDAELEQVRDAYCVEAVQEDQRLTLRTLQKYKLGLLATNATYAYDTEVFTYACKIPWHVRELLEWTAGVTPLTVVWLVFQAVNWLWGKRPKPKIAPVVDPPSPPPRDRPPRATKKVQVTHDGIRKRKDEKSLVANLNKLASLSPRLRNRIMGDV